MLTNKEMLYAFVRNLRKCKNPKDGKVSIEDIEREMDVFVHLIDTEPKPFKKFMYVEDGSVDTDELIETLEQTNPEIKVIVYRQGADRPYMTEAIK